MTKPKSAMPYWFSGAGQDPVQNANLRNHDVALAWDQMLTRLVRPTLPAISILAIHRMNLEPESLYRLGRSSRHVMIGRRPSFISATVHKYPDLLPDSGDRTPGEVTARCVTKTKSAINDA